ncbi:MAG: hypothetical protein AAF065_05510 [Verrucomicrobiota bacterium]
MALEGEHHDLVFVGDGDGTGHFLGLNGDDAGAVGDLAPHLESSQSSVVG